MCARASHSALGTRDNAPKSRMTSAASTSGRPGHLHPHPAPPSSWRPPAAAPRPGRPARRLLRPAPTPAAPRSRPEPGCGTISGDQLEGGWMQHYHETIHDHASLVHDWRATQLKPGGNHPGLPGRAQAATLITGSGKGLGCETARQLTTGLTPCTSGPATGTPGRLRLPGHCRSGRDKIRSLHLESGLSHPGSWVKSQRLEIRLLRDCQSPSARLVHMSSQPVNVEVRQ